MARGCSLEELKVLMEFESFWSIWFWIIHAVVWSLISHFPMSVPFDMIVQANRAEDENSEESRQCEAWINAAVFRIVSVFRRFGTAVVAIWFFMLSVIATLGIWFWVHIALALLTILGPATLIYIYIVKSAFDIDRLKPTGQELRNAVRKQRLVGQAIGLFGIISAATLALIIVLERISLF